MGDNATLKAQKSLLKGPVTNNGFVNFMRQYAGQARGFDVPDVVKGGKEWNRLSTTQRDKYRNMDDEGEESLKDSCCPKRRKRPCCPPPPCCPKKRRRPCCPPQPCCPVRRRPRCCPKPRCRPRPCCPKRPCCRRRIRCQRPGPVTNNGYLNFLRAYRRKHCGLKPNDLVMKAARAWCRLPECKKDRYRRQACKVTKSCRHKRRRVCTE